MDEVLTKDNPKVKLVSELAENVFTITKILNITQVVLLLFLLLFQKSSLIIYSIIFILNGGISLLLKDIVEEVTEDEIDEGEYKDKLFKNALSSFDMFVLYLFNVVFTAIFVTGLNKAIEITPGGISTGPGVGASKTIMVLLNVMIIFVLVMYKKQRHMEYFLDDLYREDILLNKFGIYIPEEKEKSGDVILCKDPDTGKPVYWKQSDRFVHMLILGPTGSGKTSQIIIPLINQDLQEPESGITVIEPKDDLAEMVYAMAQHHGREAVYFNPVLKHCPSFNPLYGSEEDVIENMATTFKMLSPDSPQFFQDMNEQLIRNALKVLKRLKGNRATMIDLDRLVSNAGGEGRKMVTSFQRIGGTTPAIGKENQDIANFFLGDYFMENSKTYEHCSGFRAQVAKIVSNKYLRKVLNPEDGKSDINFDHHLATGGVIAIATAQGKLRDLGDFLGYFLILSLQSSVFKRPKNHRPPHYLYIDEFQTYSNPGFADMLTQGRSYQVASHLATQNRALIGMGSGSAGKDFTELVSTNARNIVIFPGGNADDAKFYSTQFGETEKVKEDISINQNSFDLRSPFSGGGGTRETLKRTTEKGTSFSIDDIIYNEFREIIYTIVKDNTVQRPAMGKIEFIPFELHKKIERMTEENSALMMDGKDPNKCRDLNNYGALLPEYEAIIDDLIEKFHQEELRAVVEEFSDGDEENKEKVNNQINEGEISLSEQNSIPVIQKSEPNDIDINDNNKEEGVIPIDEIIQFDDSSFKGISSNMHDYD